MTRMIACAVVTTAGLTSIPALADVKDGVDAWSRGEYSTAIREWKGPAERGDPDAQFNLAQAYRMGRGVELDLPKAEQLYQQAASRGHLQAADNYGLLLFQRGERSKAMPYIHAAADRGDSRAQYVLGLAYFNGDNVPKDWVRAYALVSLAHQSGLPQAIGARSQMDEHIPLEQRQASVTLASELAARAEATRARQVAAANLGGAPGNAPATAVQGPPSPPSPRTPSLASAQQAVTDAARVAGSDSPASAGADFRRQAPPVVTRPVPLPRPVPVRASAPPPPRPPAVVLRPAPVVAPVNPAPARASVPVPAPVSSGLWRVQLGAFGVAGNANRLWSRVSGRAELAGHGKLLIPAGRLTKLQAGGFASRQDAQAACDRLKAGGFSCLPVRN